VDGIASSSSSTTSPPRSSACALRDPLPERRGAGTGGTQIVFDDPSGNPIELFQPADRRG
jgi:hypothetical protein